MSHADEWQEPIRIRHDGSSGPLFLTPSERADSAIVLSFKRDLELPKVPITLLPMGTPLSIGIDVGWLGYPRIEPSALCFFSGSVSAHLPSRKAYLIDGVAINGVSGGPVFHCISSEKIQIIGCVSAYHPNLVTGAALPGLLKAQDVTHFHDAAQTVRSIDEAFAKKMEFEAAQKAKMNEIAPPASDSDTIAKAPEESS